MKKFFLLVFTIVVLPIASWAQSKYSVSTRWLMHDLQPYAETNPREIPQKLINTYGLHVRDGKLCALVAIKTDDALYSTDHLAPIGAVQNSRFVGLASVDCPVFELQNLAQLPGVSFLDAGVEDAPEVELARHLMAIVVHRVPTIGKKVAPPTNPMHLSSGMD